MHTRLEHRARHLTFDRRAPPAVLSKSSKAAVNALKAGKFWGDVIDITDSFINTTKVRNVK